MVGAAEKGDTYRLLASDEPPPVETLRAESRSPFFLTCDHAGRLIPRRLGDLGISRADLERHIAWDIGAAGVARDLSARLAAPLVLQRYSRLVVDCNRAPSAYDFMTALSEDTEIPGNVAISEQESSARRREIFEPYHAAIHELLEQRAVQGVETVLVAVHSCTAVYHGVWRPWHVGVLYDKDDRFARILLELLRRHRELTVGENEPYVLSHERDYSVPVHGEQRGLPHVEFEIRQDLIATAAEQGQWADRLARVLREGLERLRAG
ncbi:MAG: N-formylglutamate amidohydrolase [Gammaproteobacteria bacterium]|nr:N-formylglutamate amidohydrolase [Gammaproteobacteria bacterium]